MTEISPEIERDLQAALQRIARCVALVDRNANAVMTEPVDDTMLRLVAEIPELTSGELDIAVNVLLGTTADADFAEGLLRLGGSNIPLHVARLHHKMLDVQREGQRGDALKLAQQYCRIASRLLENLT